MIVAVQDVKKEDRRFFEFDLIQIHLLPPPG
jgi:hypothetical protein